MSNGYDAYSAASAAHCKAANLLARPWGPASRAYGLRATSVLCTVKNVARDWTLPAIAAANPA